MTLDYYNLKEQPFGAIPDARFVFVSSSHRHALAAVLTALQGGSSFVSLIGRAGLGKTTLLFHMFNKLKENVTTIYLFQAPQSPVDFLRAILADLGVREINEVPEEMFHLLKELLADQAAQGKRVMVVIDEAQNLTPPVVEFLWVLANPASPHGKLLQFVLSGHSRMEDVVIPPESTELSYRAPIFARLEPLDQDDTASYMDYRLRVAGYNRNEPLFTTEASALIARYGEGVPRKINNLCFTSLTLGYKKKRDRIEAETVQEVVADLGLDRKQRVIGNKGAGENTPAALPGEAMPSSWPAAAPSSWPAAAPSSWPAGAPSPAFARSAARAASIPRATHPPVSARAEAARSVAKGARPSSAIPAIDNQKLRKLSSRLVPAMGLAAAVLLTATATVVNIRRHSFAPAAPALSAKPPAPASLATSPRAVIPPAAATAPAAPEKERSASTSEHDLHGMHLQDAVRALSGRSLDSICKANFGQCSEEQLQEMRRINQRLADASRTDGKHGHKPGKNSDAPADRAQRIAFAPSN